MLQVLKRECNIIYVSTHGTQKTSKDSKKASHKLLYVYLNFYMFIYKFIAVRNLEIYQIILSNKNISYSQ